MKHIHSYVRCGEVTGLVFGLLMFAARPFHQAMLDEPGWLLAVIVFLSSMSGFATGALMARAGVEPNAAVRRGVWGAALAAIVATTCFVLLVRPVSGPLAPARALLGGALSILPGMFFGMLCAAVSALIMGRTPEPEDSEGLIDAPKGFVWSIRAVVAALVAMALAVPFKSPEVVAAPSVKLKVSEGPFVPALPVVPRFAYEPPDEMATAHAMQWNLSQSRHFSGAGQVMEISRDGRWLAFVPQQSQSLRLIDLHSSGDVRQISLPFPVDRVSFNPTGERLIVASSQTPTQLGVVEAARSICTVLPKPRHHVIPEGTIFWWQDKEVLFSLPDRDPLILNLDTLEIDRAADVPLWTSTATAEQDSVLREASRSFANTSRWQWGFGEFVESAELPEVEGVQEWPIKSQGRLLMQHPEHNTRRIFSTIDAEVSDRFMPARDGSKMLRLRNGSIDVYYFTIIPEPVLRWQLKMPHGIDKAGGGRDLASSLKAAQIKALIYEPMINPLTHQVVGPDRQRVKGSLTFSRWDGTEAEVYLSGLSETVSPGDIVADVAFSDSETPTLLKLKTPHRWWTVLPEAMPNANDLAALPRLAELFALRKTALDGRDEQQRAERDKDFAMAKSAPKPEPASPPAAGIEERIKDFVKTHHRKAEAVDVRVLVDDYTTLVDYFTNGVVDHEFILQSELKYHADLSVLSEKIDGEIQVIKNVDVSGYTATYAFESKTQNQRTGESVTASFVVSLVVVETPEGLKISGQKSEKQP